MKKSAARRFSVVRTLRHVRIRYRLLASFLLLSLVPALCVGLFAKQFLKLWPMPKAPEPRVAEEKAMA